MKTIRPTKQAGSETKNHIEKHGPNFTVNRIDNPTCFQGRKAAYVTAPDEWHGWLLAAEIEITSTPVISALPQTDDGVVEDESASDAL